MSMPYFIAAMPPDGYRERIVEFSKLWNYEPGWPPHITVKAQAGLSDGMDWLERVEQVCLDSPPRLTVSLGEPTMLGSDVLILPVQSPALYALHRALVEAVNPTAEERAHYFEDGRFVLHLTLGQTQYGLGRDDLGAMRMRARDELSPFPTFDVSFLRAFYLDSDGRYKRLSDIRLGQNL